MQLLSDVFQDGGMLPSKYTCDGDGFSPPLVWSDAPEHAESFVLICDDPDAVSVVCWDHWLVFNLPASVTALEENIISLPEGARGGLNGWGRDDYGGPCPPDQKTHRYFFKLYALDTMLSFDNAPTKIEIEQAMDGHVLATAELLGRYTRRR